MAVALTSPADWYADPARPTREKQKVFRTTRQYAASLDLLWLQGNYAGVEVNGTPVVLTRGLDNEVRASYNVCRHRTGLVARGRGNRKSAQRQYHGWLYGLDGSLKNAPGFEGVENFKKEDLSLVPIPMQTWGLAYTARAGIRSSGKTVSTTSTASRLNSWGSKPSAKTRRTRGLISFPWRPGGSIHRSKRLYSPL